MKSSGPLHSTGCDCAWLRRPMALIGLLFIYAGAASAAISDYPDRIPVKGYCEFLMNKGSAANPDHQGYVDFLGTPFYNGALLLEFFGPLKNTLPAWLKWLESDSNDTPEPAGPGIYRSGDRFVLGKKFEPLIDLGPMEARETDTNRIASMLEFRAPGVKHMKGSSKEATEARKMLMRHIDTQLFGIYGALKEDTFSNLMTRSIKQDLLLSSSRSFDRQVITSPNPFSFANVANPPNPVEDMKHVAEVLHEDGDNVVVRIDLGKRPANRNQEIIQQMFFITHWQMVQKAYRDGLFDNTFETALLLLDDFIQSMKDTNGGEQIYLMYPAHAWHSMVYRMSIAHLYYSKNMHGLGIQPYRYQRISDVFYPFYPSYGMIVEKFGDDEFEMKRLFHNKNPDPLNYLQLENRIPHRYFFYHKVGKALPQGAKLMAVSKDPGTTRGYKAVGFKLFESKFYEPWNCVKDTLRMTLDEYLERTAPK